MPVEIPKQFDEVEKVFLIQNAQEFDFIALKLYHFQFAHNPVYRQYCEAINRTPDTVFYSCDIPFLPISFFKTHRVQSGPFAPALVFTSSGTTGTAVSKHYVKDPSIYALSFVSAFTRLFGQIESYCILGLLPSYLQQENSSLVYMVDYLIRHGALEGSGFYLDNYRDLQSILKKNESKDCKTLLIGVTYALLNFAEQYPMALSNTIVMETGGMKGRRKEIIRPELHAILKNAFQLKHIHSEYGMTELLSQAYSIDGFFQPPPWMKILLRDETDPLKVLDTQHPFNSGAINIIDLANIYSCSFIATEDTGKLHPDGQFEIVGRMDHTDQRGCSLLAL
ncbi:MAG: acyltransferase [Flavisolibacter sp.]